MSGAEPVRWRSVDSLAHEIGVSRMTIYRLVKAGTLPSMRIGRSVRISQADWLAYLEASRGG